MFSDATTNDVLGVARFVELLQPDSERGRERIRGLEAFAATAWDIEDQQTRAVESWSETLEDAAELRAAMTELPTLERELRRLATGEVLEEGELFRVKAFLFHGRRLYAGGAPGLEMELEESLAQLCAAIHPEPEPSVRFRLSGRLDAALEAARRRSKAARRAWQDRRAELEALVVERYGGRFDIHGSWRSMGGVPPVDEPLLEEASRGAWSVVDPELGRLHEGLESSKREVQRREYALRQRLSDELRGRLGVLERARAELGALDVRWAKARMRARLQGCWPSRSEEGPWVVLEVARAAGLSDPQPISVTIEGTTVVTGPNMGGKSALLRAIGLSVWAAHHGLPVPARSMQFRWQHGVVYVGSEERGEGLMQEGLSSFGREVRRLVSTRAGEAPRLFLLDEVGRGTHPDDGAQIACEVVEMLAQRGEVVMAATHFPAVAALPKVAHLRIAGIRDPGALRAALARTKGDTEMREALREAMNYAPIVVGSDAEVPRDARLVAAALGLWDEGERG